MRLIPILARSLCSRLRPFSVHTWSLGARYGLWSMLSYRDQCRTRRKRGSGERRIDVSVGDLAVVGMTPLISPRISRFCSEGSGGFSRCTSSRRIWRTCSPLWPPQPAEPPDSDVLEMPTPVMDRPLSSRLETPTMASHSKSLSSLPSSEARE